MNTQPQIIHTDVLIVGGSPTALALADLLGFANVNFLLIDRKVSTIAEPHAVPIDDESLHTMQALSLVNEVMKDVVAGYGVHYVTRHGGRCFVRLEPSVSEYGFPQIRADSVWRSTRGRTVRTRRSALTRTRCGSCAHSSRRLELSTCTGRFAASPHGARSGRCARRAACRPRRVHSAHAPGPVYFAGTFLAVEEWRFAADYAARFWIGAIPGTTRQTVRDAGGEVSASAIAPQRT